MTTTAMITKGIDKVKANISVASEKEKAVLQIRLDHLELILNVFDLHERGDITLEEAQTNCHIIMDCYDIAIRKYHEERVVE